MPLADDMVYLRDIWSYSIALRLKTIILAEILMCSHNMLALKYAFKFGLTLWLINYGKLFNAKSSL